MPVLVVYTLEETVSREKAMVQSFVNAMVQAMKWVKATPIDEVYALVGEKHFAGRRPGCRQGRDGVRQEDLGV